MDILRSKDADRDLVEIYRHGSARFGQAQAESCLAKLMSCMHQLTLNPLRRAPRLEFTPPVRVFPCGSHLLVYLMTESTAVQIVHVLHKRMSLPEWLGRA